MLEKNANKVRVRTKASVADGHTVGVGLGISDELGQGFRWKILAYNEKIRRSGEHSNRREISRIVGNSLVKCECGAEAAQISCQEGVPVRRCLCHTRRSDRP